MQVGKLPAGILEALLEKNVLNDARVVVGPKVGEDAAVVDMGDRYLVVTCDPVTFAVDRIGWYAVQINANDIACSGATPKWFLATLLLPEGAPQADTEEVFSQLIEACESTQVSLIGGHTEITQGIDRPIVLGCMLGEAAKDKLITTGGAVEGDSIVVTKGIAIEGTAILARERSEQLRAAGVSPDIIARARDFLVDPGISIVHEARVACNSVQVHAMHDVTEGGLATGLREVARASGLGAAVDEGSIPVLPETEAICSALGLDPLGLLASGALLITLSAGDVPTLLTALERENIDGWEIGQMIAEDGGLQVFGRMGETPLPEFDRDELARYLSSATQ